MPYFSEDMRNWTHSQASCMALGAQLAQLESLEELVRDLGGLFVVLSTECPEA